MNYTRATTAVLAAALLLGQVQSALAGEYNDAVIFGKVTLQTAPIDEGDPTAYFSVTIPATAGATDKFGNPATIWNLGDVQCGGVYDSFYNGGPGHFRVQNTGNLPAYVYISTGFGGDVSFRNQSESADSYSFDTAEILFNSANFINPLPSPRLQNRELLDHNGYCNYSARDGYALAVSTDVTAIVPSWRPLSWLYFENGNNWNDANEAVWEQYQVDSNYSYLWRLRLSNELTQNNWNLPTAYLAYMPVGETQLFDLKFWAPLERGDELNWFVIRIEASPFRRWDHDR